MQINFPGQPCGSAPSINADVNCATVPGQRYLLLTDARENTAPGSPPSKNPTQKTNTPPPDSALPANHVTLKMYDWRCLQFCENLPRT
jgi:hypothetical protein